MRALLIATSLLFGTAAMAQDAAPPGATGQPMQGDATPTPPDPGMSPPADAPTPPPPGGDTAAPAPGDASTGATPPAASAPPMAMQPGASDPASYPPCSRTVKDKCVNRGRK